MMKVEQMRIDKIAGRGFRQIMFELFDSNTGCVIQFDLRMQLYNKSSYGTKNTELDTEVKTVKNRTNNCSTRFQLQSILSIQKQKKRSYQLFSDTTTLTDVLAS